MGSLGPGAAAPTCAHGSLCLAWRNTYRTEPHLFACCRFAHQSQSFARTAAISTSIFLTRPSPLPGTRPAPSRHGLTVCLTKPAVSTFPTLSEKWPGRNVAFCWHCRTCQAQVSTGPWLKGPFAVWIPQAREFL